MGYLEGDEDLEWRFKELEDKVLEQNIRISKFSTQLEAQGSKLLKQGLLIAGMDVNQAEQALSQFTERVKVLESKVQTEILKNTVLSEVMRYYPRSLDRVIKGIDYPNEWWMERKNMTMVEWVKTFEEDDVCSTASCDLS